jgi:hypothetical protein
VGLCILSTRYPYLLKAPKKMQALAIVGLCIMAAVVYGVLHDQVTARICVEYFTIGHPRYFDTESPTLLGLGWGIIATWWVGLALGLELAIVARAGNRPPIGVRTLIRPVCRLLCRMALFAFLAGLLGYLMASLGRVSMPEGLAGRVPRDRHAAFLADGFAHAASYIVGFFGGVGMILRTRKARVVLATLRVVRDKMVAGTLPHENEIPCPSTTQEDPPS